MSSAPRGGGSHRRRRRLPRWCGGAGRLVLLVPAVAVLLLLGPRPASAATLEVCQRGCPYTQLGPALAAAHRGDNITIGPGIAWDEGVFRWILSLGTPGFLRSLNRGPIAEARARRAEAVARVSTIQDSILAAVDSAVGVCGDASRETDATSALVGSTRKSLEIAQAAYERGETGQTEVAFARVAVLRATRAHHLAEQRAREAGVALESVLGAWPPGKPRWPDLTSQTSLVTKDETR